MSVVFDLKKKDVITKNICLICDSKILKKISDVYYKNSFIFFSTSLCKNCGYVFRKKQPSNQWFSNQYKKRSEYQKNKSLGVSEKYEKFRLKRYKKLLIFLEKKIKFKTVIDIGCATGTGLKEFNRKGYKTTGIDIDNTRVNYGRKNNLNLIHSDIYKFSKLKKYDLVLCIHSLEHFARPDIVLKKLSKLMHQKSFIYIEVPDFKNTVTSWNDSVNLAHKSNFSENNLLDLLRKQNLHPLFRLYPQTENGEINIGVLCSKLNKNDKTKKNKLLKINLNSSKYNLIGNRKKIISPYKINLNLINDISFSFKPLGIKSYTYSGSNKRDLIFNNLIKKYEISEKLNYFEAKKKIFTKNLIYKKYNI